MTRNELFTASFTYPYFGWFGKLMARALTNYYYLENPFPNLVEKEIKVAA